MPARSQKLQSILGRKPKRADEVYDVLLRDIISRRLTDGQRLPSESTLCDRFGVSRPVLRDALARLKANGLLAARQGAGNFVIAPQEVDIVHATLADVLAGLEFRFGIESEAAFRAAERRTAEDLERILLASVEFERISNAEEIGISADFRFHLAIAEASHNRHFVDSLWAVQRAIGHDLTTLNLSARKSRGRTLEVQREHESIFKSIAAKECSEARRLMLHHLSNSHQRISSFLHKTP